MILFIYNFRKHKLAHSEIQQITGCLGTRRWVGNKDRQGENSKGHKNILTGDGMFIILIVVMASWLYINVKTYQIEHFNYV